MESQQSDLDVLREFLALPHRSAAVLDKFAVLPRAVRQSGSWKEGFVYLPGTREDGVLLVAHADTVGEEDIEVDLAEDEQAIRNRAGILGADDRAGCAMLWLLRNTGHGLLVTDGEESGSLGSCFLKDEFPGLFDELNSRYRFMIQIDRCGGGDFKCYDVGTEEFRAYVRMKTRYAEPDRYRSTDVVHLCRDICGVNLSCGYHDEHTGSEYLVKAEWLGALLLLRTWLSEKDLPRFPLWMNDSFVMKCIHCDGEVVEILPYTEDDPYFGHISIDIPDEKCTKCGACYMTYELSQARTAEFQKRIRNFLLTKHDPARFPDEYYNVDETTEILELKRPIDSQLYEYLIYRVEFEGRLLFWKPSVDLFKHTRDGRFKVF